MILIVHDLFRIFEIKIFGLCVLLFENHSKFTFFKLVEIGSLKL